MYGNNKIRSTWIAGLLAATVSLLASSQVQGDSLHIAVASNFSHTMRLLAKDFERSTGHETRISSASTGKLYAQIIHGAPYEIFLAADERRPEMLIKQNRVATGFISTYAIGRLALLSNIKPDGECRHILDSPVLKHFAIANPETAPYGKAAVQVLKKTGHWDKLAGKLVRGENIAQTLQFVSTGNATAGFVASSMLSRNPGTSNRCIWHVPAEMHSPIIQKMVVLNKPGVSPAAADFWKYMQSEEARDTIRNNGYDVL